MMLDSGSTLVFHGDLKDGTQLALPLQGRLVYWWDMSTDQRVNPWGVNFDFQDFFMRANGSYSKPSLAILGETVGIPKIKMDFSAD